MLDDSSGTADQPATVPGVSTSSSPSASPSASAGHRSGSPAGRAATRVAEPQRVVRAAAVTRKPAKVLARQAERQAERQARRRAAAQPVSFRIATFNVLGSQHSTPKGDHPRYPSASWRTPQAAALIARHGIDVVGTQELQEDQLNGLQRATGFAAYPGYAFGRRETDNSILYDPAKFEFVDGSSFTITFENSRRPQTILKLRERATGREMYFVNMHASAGHDRRDTGTRIAGHLTAAAVVNDLQDSGLPIFVTGDMNDRGEFFCRFLPRTGMVAAIGGSTSGGCHPPRGMAVDWITGSGGVSFSSYDEDRSATNRKVSDHLFVSALATVAPAGGR
jgi:endonuclease/exonuclease/phosphatase family metal-dependent hydrolase